MSVTSISLNEFLLFIKVQDSPNNNNPRIRNVFSLKLKLLRFLKNKEYVKVRVTINNGINFDVKNIKIDLYFLELNKNFIPT